jgi:hypothetical protein
MASPAELNIALQSNFVRTELETGHRMLTLAAKQRNMREDDSARQSLSMALVALSGAERHLASVTLPRMETTELRRNVGELRRRIDGFDSSARSVGRRTKMQNVHSVPPDPNQR